MDRVAKKSSAEKEEGSNLIAVQKVPVAGKNGLYSVIVEPRSPQVMSFSEISKILNRPLPDSAIGSNTTKPKASEDIVSDR